MNDFFTFATSAVEELITRNETTMEVPVIHITLPMKFVKKADTRSKSTEHPSNEMLIKRQMHIFLRHT